MAKDDTPNVPIPANVERVPFQYLLEGELAVPIGTPLDVVKATVLGSISLTASFLMAAKQQNVKAGSELGKLSVVK